MKNKKSQIMLGFPLDIIFLYIIMLILAFINVKVDSQILGIITWVLSIVILGLFVLNFGLIGILWWFAVTIVLVLVFAVIIVALGIDLIEDNATILIPFIFNARRLCRC